MRSKSCTLCSPPLPQLARVEEADDRLSRPRLVLLHREQQHLGVHIGRSGCASTISITAQCLEA